MSLYWTHYIRRMKVNGYPLFELLFLGELKEFCSALEAQGLKDTQSLSNVDILISPCDPDIKSPKICSISPQRDSADTNKDKPIEKGRLEAAVSFPLERSKVTQYLSSPTLSSSPSSNKKYVSNIIYSPGQHDQNWATELTSKESKEELDETKLQSHEQEGQNNNAEEEEELLVGEDQMYPTLRSKSLNANPRKMRKKKKVDEETPRTASSVKDLVSAFSGGP